MVYKVTEDFFLIIDFMYKHTKQIVFTVTPNNSKFRAVVCKTTELRLDSTNMKISHITTQYRSCNQSM